jgi:predicted peroxiredoxin
MGTSILPPTGNLFPGREIKSKAGKESTFYRSCGSRLKKSRDWRFTLTEETIEKIVVVLNHDDPQSVMAALVMSAAVASTGDQVLLFIQPVGAKILKKDGLKQYQGLKGQPDPVELFDAIQVLEGRVILCELGLPIWDMKQEDITDGVEVMMASTFLFEAEGAKMVFSY